MRNKEISAQEAAALVPDGATLGTIGGGGGLVEADALLAAIEERFLSTGAPSGLRVIGRTYSTMESEASPCSLSIVWFLIAAQ